MKIRLFIAAAAALALFSCSGPKEIKEFAYEAVSSEYKLPCDKPGTLERMEYSAVDVDGDMAEKTAYVYLPYGYDSSKKYNIIYIMHGGGANNTFYLGTNDDPKDMKHMFDHMIANGDIPPVILVMPTIYNDAKDRNGDPNGYVNHFQIELREKVIPMVEGKYSTYAKGTSEKALVASRDHRYFTGFSMGGSTTWSVFTHNMKYFRTFIPCSGDCWAIQTMGGRVATDQTVEYLAKSVSEQGYTSKDFYIYALTGKTDMASSQLTPQMEAMKLYTDMFSFGPDMKKNNLNFFLLDGGEHNAEYFANYLHSVLPFVLQ